MNRRLAGRVAGLAVAAAALATVVAPAETTDAAWNDSEHATAQLTAGSVARPQGLTCTGSGLLDGLSFRWQAPSGGLPRTGYIWTVVPTSLAGPSGSRPIADATATSITLPEGILTIGSGRFELRSTGPGGWTSAPVTADITVVGTLGIPLSTTCTVTNPG